MGKKAAFVLVLIAIVLSGDKLIAYSPQVQQSACAVGLEYVPNEIIIKFHQTVADTVEEQLGFKTSASGLTVSQDLDELNAKYRVRQIKPLLKNFRQRRRQIEALQGKNKTLLTQKEKRILRRLKRAPKDAKVPALDRIYKLELDLEEGQSLEEVVEVYNSDADVEYAELNYIVSIDLTPNDPLYPIQWPLNNTGQMYPQSGRYNSPPGTPDTDTDAPEAWDIHTGSSEIIVAVIDTGVDYDHRDLQSNMWVNEAELNGVDGVDDDENGYIDDIYGYNFVYRNSSPKDDHGHGTHVSGITAAEGDNGLDITGVCWTTRIMALKFLDWQGSGNISDAVEAFYYAVENGADVTSNSWGGGFYMQFMQDAIDYAHSQGVIMVASAGNDNTDTPAYPAYYQHMIAVAATDSDDQKATFSNYGDWVDIAAPGVDILSLRATGTSGGTIYDDYTTIASGTSMACPYISGACAFLLSSNPLLTNDEIYNILMETVDPISDGICLSDGRLNLFGAILAAVPSKGRIKLDHDYYTCSSSVSILLADYDLKGNHTHAISLTTSGGDTEIILLTEIASAASAFTGTILTASGTQNTEDGILQLSHGDSITAAYQDADDGSGNPATVTDTALVDCEQPLIFDVHIGLPGREPRIHFQTDEPTTARVLAGLDCGGPYTIEGSDSSLTTSHTVKLTGVLPETKYFFIIEAADAAGNETVETNSGRCYTFTTTGPGNIYVPAQYHTMQEAIDNSWEGGTVLVADGTYTGEGNRDLDFGGKAITVRSENGPEKCIIDCNGTEAESHRGFYFHSGEDANSVLAGFTITNGYVAGSWYVGIGGAIFCENSSPAITNCIITGNSAGWDGGGINNINSSPTIINCSFTSNSAIGNDGGAINNESSSPTIANCTFSGNSAYDWGGAIRNIFFCSPTITNCTFSGNSADDGGAMFYFNECTPTITNCTFAGNSARNGNALACDSTDHRHPSNVQLTNSILWDGANEVWNNDGSTITITYSDIQDGYEGEGNIDLDPCFVDPNVSDYHLSEDSPCIDAGDPNYIPEPNEADLDGNPRIIDGNEDGVSVVDMGAYEFYPPVEAKMKLTPQMLNCNSKGKYVKAYLTLPEGFLPEDVDVNESAIAEPMGIESEYIKVLGAGPVRLEICFDREAFCETIIETGEIEVTVIGSLTTSRYFYATGTIKIKPRR